MPERGADIYSIFCMIIKKEAMELGRKMCSEQALSNRYA
jgi:hypothetical protein